MKIMMKWIKEELEEFEGKIRRIWSKSIRNRDRKINRSTEADRKIAGKNRKNRKIRIKRNRVRGNSRSNSRRGISEKSYGQNVWLSYLSIETK